MVPGTSLTFYRGFEAHEKLLQRLRWIGLPVATMSSAMVDGLRALGAKKIVISTACADEVNKRLPQRIILHGDDTSVAQVR
jgi:arylmalonate decarboxylase